MTGTAYTYNSKRMGSITDSYYYGNSVSYSGGTYTLSTIISDTWSNLYNGGLDSYHYTCFSTGTTCSTVYYIYFTSSSYAYYIELTGGKTVEDALSEMLDNNANTSTIKGSSTTSGSIDYWYNNNLNDYTDKLEDTVWCNDRSIYQKNGWNPDGGSTSSYLYFGADGRLYANKSPSLTCERDIDKFTVSSSNGNGDLDYPVGLLTADEIAYAGGVAWTSNSTYYLYTGQYWWSLSPYYFDSGSSYAYVWVVNSIGGLSLYYVNYSRGVRPAVSLKPGTIYTSGDGSKSSPYVVS
jgi:hypothetical protein